MTPLTPGRKSGFPRKFQMMPNRNESASEPENLPPEEHLHLTIKPITERRMKLLEYFQIERDEDYRELGEQFSEDE